MKRANPKVSLLDSAAVVTGAQDFYHSVIGLMASLTCRTRLPRRQPHVGKIEIRQPAPQAAGDWFAFILIPRLPYSVGTSSAALSIRQLVVVALVGILREVLDELPIVALGVVEVHALAIGMRVRRC